MPNTKIISNILKELGVPAHFRGHDYISKAMELCAKDKSYIRGITKRLYPDIAKQYEVKPLSVERDIRYAIEISFARGSVDLITKIFGYSVDPNKGKPTNGQFIASLADYYKCALEEAQ